MKKTLCLVSTFIIAIGTLLSTPVYANPLAEAVAECRQQQNALKRLVCYDKITLSATTTSEMPASASSNAVQAHSQAPVRPAPVSNNPAMAKTAPTTSEFGLEHKKPADKNADEMIMTVSKISFSPRKELIIEFDNGQVWRQSGTDYYKIAVGEKHYVKRGLFNSFSLGNDENNRTVKVRRVD